MKHLIIYSLCALLLMGCLKESPLKKQFVSYTPAALNDSWPVSTPAAERIDSATLATIYKDVHTDDALWQIRSLLVYRNGKLVAESYMKDDKDRTRPQAVWSCTKQIMGLLVGIAVDRGLIHSIDDSIYQYLPTELANHTDKRNITIRNLLQMQSGIDYTNGGENGQTSQLLQQKPASSVEFILSRPLNAEPGMVFDYHDGNPQLVSAILQNVTGKKTDEWAQEVLFSKLNVTNLQWDRYKDGITFGAFGVLTTPRELAKFAHCAMDTGTWQGQPVVSANWIKQMTAVQVPVADEGYQFGLWWWVDAQRHIFYMAGHGGQYAFVNPAKKLVVVITAEPNTQGDFQIPTSKAMDIYDRVNGIAE